VRVLRENPFSARRIGVTRESLAEALRAHNCRYSRELEPWDEVPERWQEMWRERADWIINHLSKEAP
jgi:hypothetical protein